MYIDEKQHPDYLNDKRKFDATVTGGKSYIEDMALRAYFNVLDAGGSKQDAEKVFYNTFQQR